MCNLENCVVYITVLSMCTSVVEHVIKSCRSDVIRANVCYCVDQLSVVENRYHQVLLYNSPLGERGGGRGGGSGRLGSEGGSGREAYVHIVCT